MKVHDSGIDLRKPPGLLSYLLFMLSLVWISFATGRVTYQLGIWKYVPAFFLFSLSFGFLLFAAKRQTMSIRFDFPLLKLAAIHFLLTIIPSIFWSRGYDTAFLILVNLGHLALIFLSVNLFNSDKKIRVLMYLFAFILGLTSIFGILEYFGLVFLLTNWRYNEVGSTFFHPNIYSGFVILLLPSCYMLVLIVKKRYLKGMFAVISIFGLVNLFLARSRASLLAHFISILVLTFLFIRYFSPPERKRKTTLKVFLLLFLSIVFSLAIVLLNPLLLKKLKKTFNEKDPRLVSYSMALKIWTAEPHTVIFGNGIGSFRPLYFTYKPAFYRARTGMRSWDAVHNEYLELLVDGGLVSFLTFAFLITYIFVKAIKIIGNRSIRRDVRLTTLGFLLAALSLLVDGFFSTNTRIPVIMFFFYLILSLIETLGTKTQQKIGFLSYFIGSRKILDERKKAKFRAAAFILSVVFLITSNLLFVSRFAAEYFIARVGAAGVGAKERIKYLKLAQELQPSLVEPPYKLAENYIATRNYTKFFESSQRVNEIIPNFTKIKGLMGIARAMEGEYPDAEGYLSEYLSHDQYDITTETALIFVYAKLDEWEGVVRIFKELVEGDFILYGDSKAEPVFLEDLERVRILNDEGKIRLEYGIKSMKKIVGALLEDKSITLPVFMFRFHFVLGKTYYTLRLPHLALRHFRVGYGFVADLDRKAEKLQLEEIQIEVEKDADVRRYFDIFRMMKEISAELIKLYSENDDERRRIRIMRYVELFAGREEKEMLLQTYLKERKYKLYRRLKDLNLVIPYTQ